MNNKLQQVNNVDADLTGFDLELFLTTEVLGLKSLHYGYWKNGLSPTLSNAPKAQIEYTDQLMKLIPRGVKTILDVGSGIGDVSRALTKKGYAVDALSKDQRHKKFYVDSDPKLHFYSGEFETYTSKK